MFIDGVTWGGPVLSWLVQSAKQLALLTATLLIGVLLSLHWSAQSTRRPASPDQINQTIYQLELEQTDLKRRVGHLRGELARRQQQGAANTQLLQELRAELTTQQIQAGLVDVRGPGVRVSLDDSQLLSTASNVDDLLIHDYDLRDLVSVLWLAGAEAVSINDERVVQGTSIICVGSTIMVNDTRLSPPYEVLAIGDPLRLQDSLRNPGYLTELRMRDERFDLAFEFVRADTMTIPAYHGSIRHRFVQSGSTEAQ